MRQDTRKQLDKIQREERNKNIIRIICVFSALLALFSVIFLYRYSSGKTTEVSGGVTGLNGVPVPKRGELLYLIVELDDGKVVEVRKPNIVPFKKDERVQHTGTKSSMFGNVRYNFVKYQNDK